jgi:hypothetical protein
VPSAISSGVLGAASPHWDPALSALWGIVGLNLKMMHLHLKMAISGERAEIMNYGYAAYGLCGLSAITVRYSRDLKLFFFFFFFMSR